MCGLVGCVGDLTSFDRKTFKKLLILDTLRGDDGTGIGFVTKEQMKTGIIKAAGSPYYLFGHENSHPFINNYTFDIDVPCRVLIGHNRAATVGKLSDENSHPFEHGHIIGAHNGTLKTHLLYHLDDYAKFEVDSEAVIYNISKHGKDAIKKVAGAYALTWWDDKEKCVYFIRNKERPLYYTRSKDKKSFWWASEAWMLEVALSRDHTEHDTIQSFETDYLYRIFVGDQKIEDEFKKTELQKLEKLEGFQSPIGYGHGYGGGYGMWEDWDGSYGGSNYSANKPNKSNSSTSKGNVVTFPTGKEAKLKQLKKLYNTTISFYVDSARTGPNSIDYLACSPCDPTEDYDIRVYDNKQPLFAEMMTSLSTNDIYKARVRKAVQYGNETPYILIDYRTIEKVQEKTTIELRGHDGRFLTPDEFYDNTCKGCTWCSASVDIQDAGKIKWLDKNEFLCEECKDSPEVQQYVPQMVFN